jgi:2-hydroxychromene-2-carboxylate isomerase
MKIARLAPFLAVLLVGILAGTLLGRSSLAPIAQPARADAAATAGVTGTPSFVVNGDVVLGTNGLRDAVDRQMNKARLASK